MDERHQFCTCDLCFHVIENENIPNELKHETAPTKLFTLRIIFILYWSEKKRDFCCCNNSAEFNWVTQFFHPTNVSSKQQYTEKKKQRRQTPPTSYQLGSHVYVPFFFFCAPSSHLLSSSPQSHPLSLCSRMTFQECWTRSFARSSFRWWWWAREWFNLWCWWWWWNNRITELPQSAYVWIKYNSSSLRRLSFGSFHSFFPFYLSSSEPASSRSRDEKKTHNRQRCRLAATRRVERTCI